MPSPCGRPTSALRRALPGGRVRRQRTARAGSGLARPDPRPRKTGRSQYPGARVAEDLRLWLRRPTCMPLTASSRRPPNRSPRREDRRRQGPAHLRLDRAEHLPRTEGEGLRHRRHQDHAGDRQPRRQVRRPERPVRRPVPRRRRAGARRLRHPPRPERLRLQGTGRQAGLAAGRAALPRRGLPEGPRLGRDGSGRRRQGDAPGDPEWIKDADHPVVAPVRKALFGGWEGNWMGYNFAHDVKLQGSKQARSAS
jgi:hypothetical protein